MSDRYTLDENDELVKLPPDNLSPMAQFGMTSGMGAPPMSGGMGPPAPASAPYRDVTAGMGGLMPQMNPGMGPMAGPGSMPMAPQAPDPGSSVSLPGLMSMAQSQPQQQTRKDIGPEFKMNEHLRGLLYG